MQIYGISSVHGAQPLNGPHAIRQASARPTASSADELSISSEGNFVSLASQLPDIRADRVRDLREAISSGAYETDTKLDGALERLLDEIA